MTWPEQETWLSEQAYFDLIDELADEDPAILPPHVAALIAQGSWRSGSTFTAGSEPPLVNMASGASGDSAGGPNFPSVAPLSSGAASLTRVPSALPGGREGRSRGPATVPTPLVAGRATFLNQSEQGRLRSTCHAGEPAVARVDGELWCQTCVYGPEGDQS